MEEFKGFEEKMYTKIFIYMCKYNKWIYLKGELAIEFTYLCWRVGGWEDSEKAKRLNCNKLHSRVAVMVKLF